MNDRLYRSRDDRLLAGVAGGLAEYWDADPSLIRIVWALLTIFTGGIALLVYIVMAIVVPEDPGVPIFQAGINVTIPPTADWRSQRSAHRAAAREARRAARAARAEGPRTGTLIIGAMLRIILEEGWEIANLPLVVQCVVMSAQERAARTQFTVAELVRTLAEDVLPFLNLLVEQEAKNPPIHQTNEQSNESESAG